MAGSLVAPGLAPGHIGKAGGRLASAWAYPVPERTGISKRRRLCCGNAPILILTILGEDRGRGSPILEQAIPSPDRVKADLEARLQGSTGSAKLIIRKR